MNELTKHTEHLPNTVEDLHKFILLGREKVQAHIALIRGIDKAGIARSARDAALADAQSMAEVVLRAEAKLGELLKAIDKTDSRLRGSSRGTTVKKTLPEGISKKQSYHAQTLASHPEAITQAIEQAKKKEEVPTRAAVLRVIHRETHPSKPRELKPKPKPEPESQEALQEARSKELKGGRPLMSQSFRNAVDELKREIIRAKQSGWKETGKQTALDYITGLINAIKY